LDAIRKGEHLMKVLLNKEMSPEKEIPVKE